MALREQLKREEGLRLKPYKDTLGHWTIGYGHKMLPGEPNVRIDLAEAERLLDVDIEKAESGVRQALPWFDDLDEARQAVLVSMAFQLGLRGLLGFKRTLRHVELGQYTLAANEMLRSRWAEQTPARAERMSRQMLTGKWA